VELDSTVLRPAEELVIDLHSVHGHFNVVLVKKVLSNRGWSEVEEVVSERKEKCDRRFRLVFGYPGKRQTRLNRIFFICLMFKLTLL
jgi:hypothetical protein